MPEDHDRPLKTPEPPSPEALDQHKDEGDGPFGADMTHMLGGTRTPDEHDAGEASPYSTGTASSTGGSLKPGDPRSNYDGRSGAPDEQAGPDPEAS